MTEPIVAVSGLTKRFGAVLAVDGLDFSVAQGDVCGLLGPNGAGKTTTLRMLVGLVFADSGEARLLGHRVRPGDLALTMCRPASAAATRPMSFLHGSMPRLTAARCPAASLTT